jgi:hypothetical protein
MVVGKAVSLSHSGLGVAALIFFFFIELKKFSQHFSRSKKRVLKGVKEKILGDFLCASFNRQKMPAGVRQFGIFKLLQIAND